MKYFVINIFPVPHVIKPGFYEALSEGKKNPWLVGQRYLSGQDSYVGYSKYLLEQIWSGLFH